MHSDKFHAARPPFKSDITYVAGLLPTDPVLRASQRIRSVDATGTEASTPLEQALNGVENMLYMRSGSSSSGLLEIRRSGASTQRSFRLGRFSPPRSARS